MISRLSLVFNSSNSKDSNYTSTFLCVQVYLFVGVCVCVDKNECASLPPAK